MKSQERILQLDYIRAFAILCVIITHVTEKQGAMPLSQLFEVLFDSSVVVKYPIF